jgi:hypothetical protein
VLASVVGTVGRQVGLSWSIDSSATWPGAVLSALGTGNHYPTLAFSPQAGADNVVHLVFQGSGGITYQQLTLTRAAAAPSGTVLGTRGLVQVDGHADLGTRGEPMGALRRMGHSRVRRSKS